MSWSDVKASADRSCGEGRSGRRRVTGAAPVVTSERVSCGWNRTICIVEAPTFIVPVKTICRLHRNLPHDLSSSKLRRIGSSWFRASTCRDDIIMCDLIAFYQTWAKTMHHLILWEGGVDMIRHDLILGEVDWVLVIRILLGIILAPLK